MISFRELHSQLQLDPFYGYAPQAIGEPSRVAYPDVSEKDTGNTTASEDTHADPGAQDKADAQASQDEGPSGDPVAGPRRTRSRTVVERIYHERTHIHQIHQFRSEFRWKFFKSDIHREVIYLWCCFLDLASYRNGELLDWTWRDYIAHWNADFAFKDDELREFLRSQRLPLPAYFFPEEPDKSDDPAIIDMTVAWLNTESAENVRPKHLRQQANDQRAQRWQTRINELYKMPEHRTKTHKALCQIVASELIGESYNVETIMRRTRAPRA